MSASQVSRPIRRVITAHQQLEGAGFVVRRPFPTGGLSFVDPFLLLDEFGPVDYAPGEATGAPDHPHRGFETVGYMLEGEFEHEDSAGHRGTLNPGDVQWMTAGAGIVHSEMPSTRIQKEGGRIHGFQIWVNLPSKLKLTRPRYQEIKAAGIPQASTPDGRAQVRVIAGEVLGVKAVIETHTPIVYHDWRLEADAQVRFELPADHQTMVYVFEGAAEVGPDRTRVVSGQLAILGEGTEVMLGGAGEKGRLLVLAGVPIGETVARYGPFVMNRAEELMDAIRDYQSGRMGEITREARHT
jgi:redox-sensitive bicupin YhaK (pirin superfamily)